MRSLVLVPVAAAFRIFIYDSGENDGDFTLAVKRYQRTSAVQSIMEPVLRVERVFWCEVRVADVDDEEGRVRAEGETTGKRVRGDAKPEVE